jgi:hypothetical protein
MIEQVNYLKDMLGIVEGTIIDNSINFALGAAPAVGKVYHSYQMMKLQKRMKANEQELQILKQKIETSENEVFYKQEVFPLIVKKLMEDDEDNKAKVIIDGFEYVIDNDLNEIERIYHYYDVLAELRYSDIMMFIKRYMPYDMRDPNNLTLELDLPATIEEFETGEYKEKETIKTYQKNKMVRLGLLENRVVNIDGGDFNEKGEMSLIEEKTVITDFGRRFFKFFALDEIAEA